MKYIFRQVEYCFSFFDSLSYVGGLILFWNPCDFFCIIQKPLCCPAKLPFFGNTLWISIVLVTTLGLHWSWYKCAKLFKWFWFLTSPASLLLCWPRPHVLSDNISKRMKYMCWCFLFSLVQVICTNCPKCSYISSWPTAKSSLIQSF